MADAVGIVVIGRNEGARLIACLASLRPLDLPIVYVDSASTDGSRDVAHANGAIVVELDLARPFTAARARNEGVAALVRAHPALDHVQFVDGDCVVAPDWIDTARAFLMREPDYAVACGRRRELHPAASFYNRLADHEWDTPVGDAPACGGDALMRLSAFRAVGGFDDAMIAGEEPELCARLRAAGWRVRRLDAEMTGHDAATYRFGQWWRRAVRSGFGYAQAWRTTRRSGALYRRELARALAWTIGPTVLSLAAGAAHPAGLLLGPAAWGAQIARLAWRDGVGSIDAWRRAALLMVGKAAETWGVLKYAGRVLRGSTGGTILYK